MDNYLDTVKKKRLANQARLAKTNAQKQILETTKGGSEAVAAALAREGQLSRRNTQKVSITNNVATSDDISQVIKELKETQLASYLGGQNKSSVILADSTDLGDRVEELGDKMIAAIDAIKADNTQKDVLANLANEYKKLATTVQATLKANQDTVAKAIKSFEAAVKLIDVKPQVTVKAPTVNVPEVDLSGVSEAIKGLKTEPVEEFCLEDYTAQDLDPSNPGFQYVGLVKPDGGWAIIENDVEGNSLRYAIGVKDYPQAWENHMGIVYKRLDEAVNGIST